MTQTIGIRARRAGAIARWLLPRLLGMLVVVWGAATLAFLVLHLTPGDPVNIMMGPQSTVTQAVKDQIRTDFGLDQPLWVQYLSYLGRVAVGDFGTSYQLQRPVTAVLQQQLWPTVTLALAAIVIAVTLALVISVFARRPWSRKLSSIIELILISSPTFWIGIVLLTFFSFKLRWFPVAGAQSFASLVLPAVTLALPIAGILSQVLRHGLGNAERQPFATTALARGLGRAGLTTRHTLRHAALPAVTLAGFVVGSLLGGAVLIEQIFGRPGLGRVALQAISNKDTPVVMAIVILAAIVFVVVNLIVDLLYPLIDPRLRQAATTGAPLGATTAVLANAHAGAGVPTGDAA